MDDNFRINIRTSASILNNSFDLIDSAIQAFKQFDGHMLSIADSKDLKAALGTTTTCIELLLKSKIASIDWTQLFQTPSKADKNKLLDGSLYSVKFEDCLDRIERVSSIKFNDRTKRNIEAIRVIRNKILHFHAETKVDEYISLISTGLDIFIEFYRDHIFAEFCEDKDRTKAIDEELKKVKEYVKTRLTTLREKHKKADKPKTYYFCECSNCLQDAFIIQDKNTVKCVFCGQEDEINEVAEFHSNFNNLTKPCPKCDFQSMTAMHSNGEEEEAWDCVICGYFINRPRQWRLSYHDNSISTDSVRKEIDHRS